MAVPLRRGGGKGCNINQGKKELFFRRRRSDCLNDTEIKKNFFAASLREPRNKERRKRKEKCEVCGVRGGGGYVCILFGT